MSAEHQYFFEDEVYRITRRGNVEFGMVLENSELVSSDENSDVEEGGRMKKGHIRVAWHPTGVEEVILEKKVQLADRSLMPGDVVRRMIKGKDTQRGYCRDIKVTACVQVVGSKQVIPNVKSEKLVPLEAYATDVAACLDSWVGGIKTSHSKLILQCSDGSRCVVNDIEACGLEDFNEKRDYSCEFPGHRDYFYPGQTLWGPVQCLDDAEWIYCTKELKAQRAKPNKTVKVIVEEVQTDSVGVQWQCRAYSKDGAGIEKEQPKFLVQGDDLKRLGLLNVFEPCTLQVGDRNFYTFLEENTVITKEQWRRSQRELLVSGPGAKETASNRSKYNLNKNKESEKLLPQERDCVAPPSSDAGAVTNGVMPVITTTLVPSEPTAEHEDWDSEDTASMSDTTSISSGCSSIGSQGKKKKGPALMTKVLKKKKLRRTRKRAPLVALTPGSCIVVETLSTNSIADVVWQDGSVEKGIHSTQLYPIHHLDDQEFFPGDFVIENKDESCMRVYGVVQGVDHAGRTASVKWFRTYTSQDEPRPALLDKNEVSVYDLKDHPDFQYRPGTVVIRVANFEGADSNCTAGQVLDNYPEGMVRVWWVDGHVSMSWPQDLYKVGEYDSDEGELWDDGSSDGSWETESEDCVIAEDVADEEAIEEMLKPKLAANIEKARIAMSRLEEIFTQNPSLQTTSVMRQLLDVYKDCRYLDKLMGTSFFHESHFQGLLERVRERGRANVAQRVADQVNRLFQHADQLEDSVFEDGRLATTVEDSGISSNKDSSGSSTNESFASDDGEKRTTSKCHVGENHVEEKIAKMVEESYAADKYYSTRPPSKLLAARQANKDKMLVEDRHSSKDKMPGAEARAEDKNSNVRQPGKDKMLGARQLSKDKMLGENNAEDRSSARQSSKELKSGSENHVETRIPSVRQLAKTARPTESLGQPQGDDRSLRIKKRHAISLPPESSEALEAASVSNSHVCVKLCSLIKAQLVKAHSEVTRRFGGNQGLMTLSDAFKTGSPVEMGGAPEDENEGSRPVQPQSDPKVESCRIPKLPPPEGVQGVTAEIHRLPILRAPEENRWTKGTPDNGDETAVSAAPIAEMVKDGLMDMFNVLARFKSGAVPSSNSEFEISIRTSSTLIGKKKSSTEVVACKLSEPSEPPLEQTPSTTASEELVALPCSPGEGFSIMDSAPSSHKFKLTMFQPTDPQNFFRTVRKEIKLLRTSLPAGIWVKGFEDRMDLYSVMIRGPEKTPYEDGLFFFDFQLSAEYPKAPPLCHYISYCSDRLNPNLYEDGKVCVSLLGTWSGKGTEVWTLNSNLMQVIVSIQGLILVSEPYFNEAGYEKQKGSQQGKENSRMYNEMAVLKLVQSMTKLIVHPTPVFQEDILQHFRQNAYRLIIRLETWLEISERYNNAHPITPTTPTSFREVHGQAISSTVNAQLPEFPLIPASKGFCLTLRKTLVSFREALSRVGIDESNTAPS